MNHKYQHLLTLQDLDSEIAMLRIRKEVIKQEAMANFQNIKSGVSGNLTVVGAMVRVAKLIYRTLRPAPANRPLDKVAHIAELIAQILGSVSNFRKES